MKKILYLLVFGLSIIATAQTTSENFVKTTVFKDANGTNPSSSVTYFDGLGRPIQSIAQGQSASGNDIITHTEYDTFGRQEKDYLPYVGSGNSMAFDPSGQGNTMNFYANSQNVQNPTNVPFSQKLLEASPLNRVLKQAAPGDAWQMGSNHEIKLDYQTNHGTEVKNFVVTTTWNASTKLYDISIALSTADGGFYAANQLYKTATTDENSTGVNNEFKDKEGRVVLKQTFNNGASHDTYYIYDIYGNLTYVIPPLANASIALADLEGLCYQYKYDHRNRLVEKKLPGKQWEFIVYDKLNRVVATGPAFAPFPDFIAQGKTGWMITKYDVFNRPVYTGWEMVSTPINTAARALKQGNQNSATILNETKTTATTLDGIAIAYSNNVMPTSFKLLTINYYDDYNYPNATSDFNPVFGETVFYDNTQKPKGMPTGSWVRVLEHSDTVRGESTFTLYDYKARPIRSFMQNYLGGYAQVDSKLDFMGKTLFTETRHKRTASVTEMMVREDFTYSAQDRLLTHTHQINNEPAQTLVNHEYTEFGQLKTKYVGNYNGTTNPLQKVDYTYNIRGWLTDINDVSNLQQSSDPNDLFSFRLNYNKREGHSGAIALFNGNISETFWRTASDNVVRSYGYQYDHLNRLNNAIYEKPEIAGTTNSYNESLTYDKNGNITSLNRNGYLDNNDGTVLEIDKLDYQYSQNSNRLQAVTDASNSLDGFRDGNPQGDDYGYDNNGNMTTDLNKGIETISYNHLNLPSQIFFANQKHIDYIYNAVGNKVQKVIGENGTKTVTHYLSGFQYKLDNNGVVLKFFPHAEGYVNVEDDKFNYVYNYTDHLGNVRLSYAEKPGESSLKIIEESNYYPFGLKHANYNAQKFDFDQTDLGFNVVIKPVGANDYNYKYNGKEFQDELGLNMYDYGARLYMPDIGRFAVIDPMADFVNYQSPYVISDNNPIMNVDDYGLGIFRAIGNIFSRLAFGVKQLFSGANCNCSNFQGESVRDAWNQPDFLVLTEKINNFFSGTGQSTTSTSSTDGEGRALALEIGSLNSAGITVNNNISIQSGNINIPTAQSSPLLPRPVPIPIIGNRASISFNRDVEFVSSSSKLNTPHTQKSLRDLVKTLVDYPQLIVSISANVSVVTDQPVNSNTGVRVDGQNGTIGGLQSARARAIQRFLIKRGVNPKQIFIKDGAINTDGRNPDATFKLTNPNK